MELYCLQILSVFLLITQRNTQCEVQDETMIRYIEKRILSLEDRLLKCEQDVQHYLHEFQELSHKLVSSLDKFSSYKVEVKGEMENLWARLERAEWDIDYLESTSSSKTQVEVDDKLMEKQLLEQSEEKRKRRLKFSTSCTIMLAQIQSLKTVKKSGGAVGAWMKNAGDKSKNIYFFTSSSNNLLLEFANIEEFTSRDFLQRAESIKLPFFWQGTGLQVYKNEVFFHKKGTMNEIVRYNIQKNITQSMNLEGAGHSPPYQLSPYTKIDLAIDEQGLWAIHAEPEADGNLVLTKIDQADMAVTQVWNTTCSSYNAEAAFVICGTLYVMYNSPNGGRSHIDCIFDTSDVIDGHETPTLYFPKRYSHHSSVHYNPRDQMLYGWDDGYQIIYRFEAMKKYENF
ncbi:PREDICTED: olfactomedin-like protein 1 [Nanorana parkeri]|uniref:olfactomedin-like protein 1 n=1 Tax=Nanorana parkeri TaxID=125878 RepID=UPI0008541DFE|nr:PREDICTED: olfactomedin-like protein 1 [Nanorana parkeri]